MKRTTVFADEADLAVLKAAATRRGVPEAQLLREAIHLAAMADRTWDEPFFTGTFAPVAEPQDDDRVAAYERTRHSGQ